jgi:hypothetical protein
MVCSLKIWNLEFWEANRQTLLLPLVGAIENLRDILNIWLLGVFMGKHLRI